MRFLSSPFPPFSVAKIGSGPIGRRHQHKSTEQRRNFKKWYKWHKRKRSTALWPNTATYGHDGMTWQTDGFMFFSNRRWKNQRLWFHGCELLTHSHRNGSLRVGQSECSRTLLLVKHKGDVKESKPHTSGEFSNRDWSPWTGQDPDGQTDLLLAQFLHHR